MIHKAIQILSTILMGSIEEGEKICYLFPSQKVAARCVEFITSKAEELDTKPHIETYSRVALGEELMSKELPLYAVLCARKHDIYAKAYWQHTGEGISSRLAEQHLQYFSYARAAESTPEAQGDTRSPFYYERYSQKAPLNVASNKPALVELEEPGTFLDERFGRNLDSQFGERAKTALRRRISNILQSAHNPQVLEERRDSEAQGKASDSNVGPSDIYLCPTGMSSIFNAHRALLHLMGNMKSICFG